MSTYYWITWLALFAFMLPGHIILAGQSHWKLKPHQDTVKKENDFLKRNACFSTLYEQNNKIIQNVVQGNHEKKVQMILAVSVGCKIGLRYQGNPKKCLKSCKQVFFTEWCMKACKQGGLNL